MEVAVFSIFFSKDIILLKSADKAKYTETSANKKLKPMEHFYLSFKFQICRVFLFSSVYFVENTTESKRKEYFLDSNMKLF